MIRTDQEYNRTQESIRESAAFIAAKHAEYTANGCTPEQVERGLQPLISFHLQKVEEADWYKQITEGQIPAVYDLADMGRLLIALRIREGWTQRQLAERLGVSESQVSRDERNEYHGITLERTRRILEALGAEIKIYCQQPPATATQPVPEKVTAAQQQRAGTSG